MWVISLEEIKENNFRKSHDYYSYIEWIGHDIALLLINEWAKTSRDIFWLTDYPDFQAHYTCFEILQEMEERVSQIVESYRIYDEFEINDNYFRSVFRQQLHSFKDKILKTLEKSIIWPL